MKSKSFKKGFCTSKSSDENYDEYENASMNKASTLCCGIICTKSMSIIFNFLFILTGVALILLSVWTMTTKQDYVNLFSSKLYQASTYILIGAGALIVITGIIGIIGAWIESKNLLIAFIFLLILIFVIELSAGILAFAYRVRLKESLKSDLDTIIIEQYGQEGFERKTNTLDELQQKFKCCGSLSFLDWKESKYVQMHKEEAIEIKKNNTYNKVAESCCKSPSTLCAKRDHPSNINVHGCVLALEKYVASHIILIGIVSCGICSFQAIGILITALLIRRINQRKQYDYVKANDN